MPIDATCPNCMVILRVPEKFAGQTVDCPKCNGGRLTVPNVGPHKQQPPEPRREPGVQVQTAGTAGYVICLLTLLIGGGVLFGATGTTIMQQIAMMIQGLGIMVGGYILARCLEYLGK